jgi:hypothetical protein
MAVIPAGGIAEFFTEIGEHKTDNLRVTGRGGSIIQVYGQIHEIENYKWLSGKKLIFKAKKIRIIIGRNISVFCNFEYKHLLPSICLNTGI